LIPQPHLNHQVVFEFYIKLPLFFRVYPIDEAVVNPDDNVAQLLLDQMTHVGQTILEF